MALEARSPSPKMPELDLPPPFSPVRLREMGDAFAHARSIAADSGAGTLVYVGRFDTAEFALVLEPDEPLRTARRAFYAGMAALADALAAHAEPETAIALNWPDSISVNLGLVGGGRLAWPEGAAEDEVPEWLVFGAMVRVVSMSFGEPGLTPLATALSEEGFGEVHTAQIMESFARHFMVAVDSWQEAGFDSIARVYLPLLTKEQGVRRSIDVNGDLLVQRMASDAIERRSLVAALATPSWLDSATGAPRI